MPAAEPKMVSATKWPPGIVRKRQPCPYCGRMIKPQFAAAYAQHPYRHKCPHGRWCAASKKKFWCREDDRCPQCAEERAREAEAALSASDHDPVAGVVPSARVYASDGE